LGPSGIGLPGPGGQECQRLSAGEYVYGHARTKECHRLPVAGDDHPGSPGGRDERPQQLRVDGVIEDQQAPLSVRLQPVPHRPASCLRIPGTWQAQRRGDLGQAREQPAHVGGVYPRDQPPALV
jgi:hypothetical protein